MKERLRQPRELGTQYPKHLVQKTKSGAALKETELTGSAQFGRHCRIAMVHLPVNLHSLNN
jgi:hypothetical protein